MNNRLMLIITLLFTSSVAAVMESDRGQALREAAHSRIAGAKARVEDLKKEIETLIAKNEATLKACQAKNGPEHNKSKLERVELTKQRDLQISQRHNELQQAINALADLCTREGKHHFINKETYEVEHPGKVVSAL